jgi:hypothetical protein
MCRAQLWQGNVVEYIVAPTRPFLLLRATDSRKVLLSSLLRALVDEWGHKEVEVALARLSPATSTIERHMLTSGQRQKLQGARAKLLASEQVARAPLPDAQKAALQALAIRFDQKQFLPSNADVREFLLMMGETPGTMKDRSDAFRRLLKSLSVLSPDRLDRLVKSALHSGPSQLSHLSDAISAAAASLPRNREPSSS